MKMKAFLSFVFLCLMISAPVHAKRKYKTKMYFGLIEAYSQQIIPGARHAHRPPATIHFIVVWENSGYPDSFFWNTDTSLLKCSVTKVHKVVNKMPRAPMGIDYYTDNTAMKNISKGDTLDVKPILGSNAVIAGGIPAIPNQKNTLFVEIHWKDDVNSLHWLHVDAITKKHDIEMP